MTSKFTAIPDPVKANRWHAYMQGWRDGAAARAMKVKDDHPDRAIVEEYSRGYTDGGTACMEATKAASARIGHEPSPLR